MTIDIPQWIIAGGVLVGIGIQWWDRRVAAKARAAVAEALRINNAEAKRAADEAAAAAVVVAEKASEHAEVLAVMAENIQKIEEQGNSNATRLEEAARAQGHLAGLAEGRSEKS